MLKTLNSILPYTPRCRPKPTIVKNENSGKTNTSSNKFCIIRYLDYASQALNHLHVNCKFLKAIYEANLMLVRFIMVGS